ncbi:MAG TPA: hypothetical protein VMR50_05455 [Myxococcota bacterium]|nr:hypothetical protein [Myxococcota bacterium]
MLRKLAGPYAAGALAALFTSLVLWIAVRAKLGALVDVQLGKLFPGGLELHSLGWHVLEGSLFALALPLARGRGLTPVRAGLLISLLPSLRALFLQLPGAGYGMLGVQLGALTPVVVLAANGLWGWFLGTLVGWTGGAEGAT